MGYSVYMYKIFGVKIPGSEIKRKEKKRGCNHPEGSGKFCSECGKPMWIENTYNILESEENGLSYFYSDYEGWEKNEVILGFKLESLSSQDNYPHAFAMSISQDDVIKFKKMFQEICDFCEEHKITINPTEVTTWSLMVHSY